ncbi:MAG: hypothetical protein HKN88_08875 [Gammaproteobacteria bacterium]|nr:VanZ family protein [Gammaproteobacteria bacterium]NNC98167.1 hypothetical protein [Gammaproteobacteria bacterium]NNM13267.1 hypothetical protein [Gammaproteobacteria bacterium]
MYQLKYRYVWIILGLLLTGTITYLSLIPLRTEVPFGLSDKVVHFVIYFTVTIWFVGIVQQRFFWLLGLVFFVFSYAIEVLQGMTTYRRFEWSDLLANGVGIAVALLLGMLLFKGWCQWFESTVLKISHPDV